jgi:hypothetical protein
LYFTFNFIGQLLLRPGQALPGQRRYRRITIN